MQFNLPPLEMNMRKIFAIILFLPIQVLALDWKGVQYDEARLYIFNFGEKSKYGERLIMGGKINPNTNNGAGYLLNEGEVSEFREAVSEQQHETPAGLCYNPRHGVVFYKNNKIVAWVEWCFECLSIQGNPKINNVFHLNWGALAIFIEDKKLPINKEKQKAMEFNAWFHKELKATKGHRKKLKKPNE